MAEAPDDRLPVAAAGAPLVLVVDQSRFACLFLVQHLEQEARLTCHYALDVAESLQTSRNSPPSVVIRSAFLADRDVLASVETLRREPVLAGIPLILYGELDEELGRPQWQAAGVSEFVPSSAGPENLRQAVLGHAAPAPTAGKGTSLPAGSWSPARHGTMPPTSRGRADRGVLDSTPVPRRAADLAAQRPSVVDQTARVMMIDDSRTICLSCREKIIHHPNIVFEFCTDPRLAVAKALDFGPTVLLMDLEMPGLSGFELLPLIKGEPLLSDVPVIVLSGIGDARTKAELFRLGANDYAEKNMDEVELYSRIRYHSQACVNGRHLTRSIEELIETQKRLKNQRNFIRKTFGRYLSDAVVSNILETPEGLDLGGEKRVISIMMADLRGFTSLSERLPPEMVLAIVNNFLQEMTDLLFSYDGTIDEFLGDAILAMFGAPLAGVDDALRAVACAVAMQLAMTRVNEWNESHGFPVVGLGIGINTGEVVVGNIGSERRAKYGIVGRHVNLTARIESCTVGGQIMVSDSTVRACGSVLRIDGQHQVAVKGIADPITVYEVGGVGGGYDLYLPAKAPQELPRLEPPIEVRLIIMEGKRSGSTSVPGRLVRWLDDEAHVETRLRVEPLTDLKIALLDEKGKKIRGDLYGKVRSSPGSSGEVLVLSLTSISPPVQAVLARHQRSACGEGGE